MFDVVIVLIGVIDVGSVVDVGVIDVDSVVVVNTIQTPQTHFPSLTSPWVLSPHSTGAKVATPAKVKTWPSCCRSEIIQVLLKIKVYNLSRWCRRSRGRQWTRTCRTWTPPSCRG